MAQCIDCPTPCRRRRRRPRVIGNLTGSIAGGVMESGTHLSARGTLTGSIVGGALHVLPARQVKGLLTGSIAGGTVPPHVVRYVRGVLTGAVAGRSTMRATGVLTGAVAGRSLTRIVGTLTGSIVGQGAYRQANPVMMADQVADSAGVNVHLEYGGSVYDTAYASSIKPALIELGVRHIRGGSGGPSLARYQELLGYGIKLLLINTTYTAATSYMQANANFVEDVENRNEPDVFDNTPTNAWQSGLRSRVIAFWQAVRANAALNGIRVLNAPLGHANNLTWWHANFADFGSYCDVGTVHDYCGTVVPENQADGSGSGWNGFGSNWSTNQLETIYRQDLGNTKPIYSTEFGNRYDGGITANQAAKAMIRGWLVRVLGYKRARVYFYELRNYRDPAAVPTPEDFGMITYAGAKRQVFHAVRNMIALCADPGAAFATSALAYSISGTTTDMASYVVQRRDGRWLFMIWRGLAITDAEATRQSVTLTFGTPMAMALRHEPTLATSSYKARKQSYLAPAALTFGVPDHPVVIEAFPTSPYPSRLNWRSGMDLITDANLAQATALGTFRGRALDCTMCFLGGTYYNDVSSTGSWAKIISTTNSVTKAGGQAQVIINAGMWAILAVPLCLTSESGQFQAMYNSVIGLGDYYTRHLALANTLRGWYGTSGKGLVLRLGWEGNHGYPWSVLDSPSRPSVNADSAYYARWWSSIARIYRDRLPSALICFNGLSVAGSGVKFGSDHRPDLDCFDIVGCDKYDDNGPGYNIDNETHWQSSKGSYNASTGVVTGVQGYTDFAIAIEKLLAFDEWGPMPDPYDPISTNPNVYNNGGQNNSFFPQRMFQHFQEYAHIMAYENYFNGNERHTIEPVKSWTTNTRAGYLTAYTP